MDAPLTGFLVLEQVQGNMTKKSKVFRPVILPHPATVLIKGNIQHPMQLIFDPSMRANRVENSFGSCDTGNVIAVLTTLVITDLALRMDPRYSQQVFPVGEASQVLQDFRI